MDPIPMPWLKCQKVDDTYVLRDGASGLFLAASGFQKIVRHAPLVSELLMVKDHLDPKYQLFWLLQRQIQMGIQHRYVSLGKRMHNM